LKELLDIQIFGRRKKLFKKMQNLIKENEKLAEDMKALEDIVDKTGVPALMRKNTTLIK